MSNVYVHVLRCPSAVAYVAVVCMLLCLSEHTIAFTHVSLACYGRSAASTHAALIGCLFVYPQL